MNTEEKDINAEERDMNAEKKDINTKEGRDVEKGRDADENTCGCTDENTCGCTDEPVCTVEEKDINIKEEGDAEESTCGCTDEPVCTVEDTVEEEDRDIIKDIMKIFGDKEYAYPLTDVIAELKELGYENPGTVVTLALQDDLLYVDSIEDVGVVYLAISEQDEEE